MLYDIFNRIQRIDYLIRRKATGNATQLANKLGLSRTSIYEYLDLMKHFGAPIKYNISRKSFYYVEEGRFPTEFLLEQRDAETSTESNPTTLTL